jgi:hypothetical protein
MLPPAGILLMTNLTNSFSRETVSLMNWCEADLPEGGGRTPAAKLKFGCRRQRPPRRSPCPAVVAQQRKGRERENSDSGVSRVTQGQKITHKVMVTIGL